METFCFKKFFSENFTLYFLTGWTYSQRFPRASWSASMASKSDLKLPAPNPCMEHEASTWFHWYWSKEFANEYWCGWSGLFLCVLPGGYDAECTQKRASVGLAPAWWISKRMEDTKFMKYLPLDNYPLCYSLLEFIIVICMNFWNGRVHSGW